MGLEGIVSKRESNFPPGDCVPGVIVADGVGVEGFAAGVCGDGVAGLALSPGAGDDTVGVTAAEGVAVDGLADGVCDGFVPSLARPPGAGGATRL
jgi:hypothetical protein